jgi:hypothetical protein
LFGKLVMKIINWSKYKEDLRDYFFGWRGVSRKGAKRKGFHTKAQRRSVYPPWFVGHETSIDLRLYLISRKGAEGQRRKEFHTKAQRRSVYPPWFVAHETSIDLRLYLISRKGAEGQRRKGFHTKAQRRRVYPPWFVAHEISIHLHLYLISRKGAEGTQSGKGGRGFTQRHKGAACIRRGSWHMKYR